jgi:hypothetical protein
LGLQPANHGGLKGLDTERILDDVPLSEAVSTTLTANGTSIQIGK